MSFRRMEGYKAVAKMLNSGELAPAKTRSCVDCGAAAFCYDHRDYRKPSEVEPVCKKCDSKRGEGKPHISMHSEKYRVLLMRALIWYLERELRHMEKRKRELRHGKKVKTP